MFFLLACSEAADSSDPTTTATSTASTTSSVASTVGSAGSGGGSTTAGSTGSGGSVSGVVLNEVSGLGDDYVEIFNAGSTPVDLSDFIVADDDAGSAKLAEAVTFPSGTVLAPGSYLFVLAGMGAATMPGPQTVCAPGPSPCFHASFGISKSGDVIYLLDGANALVEKVSFPGDTVDGQSFGRLPNGTGAFKPTKATPGAVNAAP